MKRFIFIFMVLSVLAMITSILYAKGNNRADEPIVATTKVKSNDKITNKFIIDAVVDDSEEVATVKHVPTAEYSTSTEANRVIQSGESSPTQITKDFDYYIDLYNIERDGQAHNCIRLLKTKHPEKFLPDNIEKAFTSIDSELSKTSEYPHLTTYFCSRISLN